jgi:peptide/nickel transport system permease protein
MTLRRHPGQKFWFALTLLVILHGLVLLAAFLAPYDPAEQNRFHVFVPPTKLRFVDAEGAFHIRPFVYEWSERSDAFGEYEENLQLAYPLRFFVPVKPYRLAGVIPLRWRFLGVEEPGRVFLLGTDSLGRDQFSRLLHGGRISLFAGLLAAALTLFVGMVLGTLSGFFGGKLDNFLMRTAELFLALPWLYLLFAVRAFLPLSISPVQAFLLVTVVIGLVGWARPARLIRGVVLSARERDYVLAARGFGASSFYLLRRHILPQTYGVVFTQAALLIPQYILAEVTLSFLGLGVGEPTPSWGNMLASLQEYHVLASYWWMFIPGLVLFPIFAGFSLLSDSFHEQEKVFL